ncbi:MAG: hypothetical protein AAF701_04750, partial [Pseudomonadota bacterium]
MPHPTALAIHVLAFTVAGILAYFAANQAATYIENSSAIAVEKRLVLEGHDWATVDTDGLQVIISGEAPSEATRFKALTAIGTVVEAARVIDSMTVAATSALAAPNFSLEILRNDGGISLIGLIPLDSDPNALLTRITQIAQDTLVSNFMETANYAAPDLWEPALNYGLNALNDLERAKISITEDGVNITGLVDSDDQKTRLETRLARRAPTGVATMIDIFAPRPVITPFTLRFQIANGRAGFDACSADTEDAAQKILATARTAGLET